MLKAVTIAAAGVLVMGGTGLAVASHGGTHTNTALNHLQLSANVKTSSHPNMEHWGGQKGFMGQGMIMANVAKDLNVSVATLKTDVQNGQSLAQIAQAHNVSVTTLESSLAAQAKAAVQSAVTSGKMTQADATLLEAHLTSMVDTAVTQTPTIMKDGRMMFKDFTADTARALNISTATLKADLSKGQSLATIAQAQGSSTAALEASLTADAQSQIQSAVSSGQLTSSEATTLEAHLSAMIDKMVTAKGGMMHSTWGLGHNMGMMGWMKNVAKSLNISNSTLRADLKDGQSLATIANAHGVSTSTLEATLLSDATAQMQKAVTSGKMTQAQATKMESHLSKTIDQMVTHTGMTAHSTNAWHGHGQWKAPSSTSATAS